MIVSDDQGAADAGCYGAKDLDTPSMDGLAARGVRFTQFYAAAPVCSPSRAGLLTGRYPLRAGLPGNASSRKGEPGHADRRPRWPRCSRPPAMPRPTSANGTWASRPRPCPTARDSTTRSATWAAASTTSRTSSTGRVPTGTTCIATASEVYYPGRFFPDLMIEEAVAVPAGEPRAAVLPLFCLQHAPLSLPGGAEMAGALQEAALPAKSLRRVRFDARRSGRAGC